MAMAGKQAKVASLSGSPSKQANKNMNKSTGMPKMSPGKPAGLPGKPSSVSTNKATKQPKRKGGQRLKAGTVKGITKGRVAAADMGIG